MTVFLALALVVHGRRYIRLPHYTAPLTPDELMNGGGDDDADADGHGADQNRERHVVFLDDFFPEMVGSRFVDDDERQNENQDAYERVGESADDVAERN
jgi:hypothetical protein